MSQSLDVPGIKSGSLANPELRLMAGGFQAIRMDA